MVPTKTTLRCNIAVIKARIERAKKANLKEHVMSLTSRLRQLTIEYQSLYEYENKGFSRVDLIEDDLSELCNNIILGFEAGEKGAVHEG